jgi:hypothetical protein
MNIDLTHFFTTSTYKTILTHPDCQVVWRDSMIPSSLSQPALLRGILTTAALHKIAVTDCPATKARYTGFALQTQGYALKSFIAILNEPSPANCGALFCLSILLSVWTFASLNLPAELNTLDHSTLELRQLRANGDCESPTIAGDQSQPRSAIDGFLKIVAISQGVHTVLKETFDWLKQTEMGVVLRPIPQSLPPMESDVRVALEELERFLRDTTSSGLDPDELPIFVAEIETIRELFCVSQCPEWHDRILGWPIMLSSAFIAALKESRPPALTILAYWASCFYVMDGLWWAHGWPEVLMRDVCSIVQVPWKRHLELPAKLLQRRHA